MHRTRCVCRLSRGEKLRLKAKGADDAVCVTSIHRPTTLYRAIPTKMAKTTVITHGECVGNPTDPAKNTPISPTDLITVSGSNGALMARGAFEGRER